jgi:hypothetical protein
VVSVRISRRGRRLVERKRRLRVTVRLSLRVGSPLPQPAASAANLLAPRR